MDKGKNRAMLALGMAGAVLLLLGAFTVVWLMPRGPESSSAQIQPQGSQSTVVNTEPIKPQAPQVVKDLGVAAPQSGIIAAPVGAPINETPHISVRGAGVISAKPDIVNLQIGVQIQKTSLADAQSEAATKADALISALKAAGVAEKDIATAQYSVEPVMDYSRNNEPPRLVGFRVTNILNVKIRDTAKAGQIIDDQVKAGANTVYGLSFGFSDPTALMRQAREEAMKDAKAKADQLASLGGVTLGTIIVIDDGGANVPPPVMQSAGDMAAERGMAANAPTPINPGQQEIRVEVSVVFAIK